MSWNKARRWLIGWFHGGLDPESWFQRLPEKRSYKDNDELSDDEKRYISETNGKCPDCTDGELLEGPSGGMNTNYLCKKCGSKFNLCLPFGQRISDSSLYDDLMKNQGELQKIRGEL